MHRSQFVTGKQATVFSDANLGKDRRTRAMKPDGNNDEEKHRPANEKEQGAGQNVKRSLHHSRAPMSVDPGLHHVGLCFLVEAFNKPKSAAFQPALCSLSNYSELLLTK
jgi:hypothetical protein